MWNEHGRNTAIGYLLSKANKKGEVIEMLWKRVKSFGNGFIF